MDLKGLKVYRVRLWILERKKGGGGYISPPAEHSDVITINNLEQAKTEYNWAKSRFNMHKDMAGYRGFVELFEASVDDRGRINNYPENEQYIERETVSN